MSEADVSGEFIEPLLKALGYRTNTSNDVRRQLSLRYPHSSLGRKKPNDPPLQRGRADYVCEVDRKIRWIIEAKPTEPPLTEDDIEQAFTYARHPEIRGVYYCLCNGCEFRVYAADSAPGTGAILVVDPAITEIAAQQLAAYLGPDQLRRRHSLLTELEPKALGPGLLSFAQVIGGRFEFQRTSIPFPFLDGFVVAIRGGSIQRDADNNTLIAYLESISPLGPLQRINERLGLDRLELTAPGLELSSDPTAPTQFSGSLNLLIPRGEHLYDVMRWEESELPVDMACEIAITSAAVLAGSRLSGSFDAVYLFRALVPNMGVVLREMLMTVQGIFAVDLK